MLGAVGLGPFNEISLHVALRGNSYLAVAVAVLVTFTGGVGAQCNLFKF